MKMFDQNNRTYKTAANAEKALRKLLADNDLDIDFYHWMIGVNSDGRYYPVLTGTTSGDRLMAAFWAHKGICCLTW